MPAVALSTRCLALAAAASALSSACASYVARSAESAILEALPQAVWPADRYKAQVQGANGNAAYFDQVRASGVRARRANLRLLDRVEVWLRDATLDRQAKRLTAIDDGAATVWRKEADLAAGLQQQPWIDSPAVRFGNATQIVVTGRSKLPYHAVPSRIDAVDVEGGTLVPTRRAVGCRCAARAQRPPQIA